MTHPGPPHHTLRPVISLPRLIALTFAVIAPSASVFLTYGSAYRSAGTGVVIGYLIAAGLNLLTMLGYAEVGSLYPRAGGDYSLAANALGRKVGSLYTVFFACKGIAIPAVLSLAAASYIHILIPSWPLAWTAIFCLAIFIAIACLDLTTSSRVIAVMVGIEAFVYLIFMVASLLSLHQPISVVWHPMIAQHGTLVPVHWSGIWLATTTALYGYNGAQACLYYSEETEAQPRDFGKTVITATLVTIAVEFLGVLVTTLALPHLAAERHGAIPLAALLGSSRWGRTLLPFMVGGISIALIDTGIATTMGYGRIYYAIARDGQWPWLINRLCLQISRRRIPYGALLLIGALNFGMILLSGVTYLILLTGSLLLLIYLGIAVSALVSRGRRPPYRMPFWPLVPVLTIIALLFLLSRLDLSQLYILGAIVVLGGVFAATDAAPPPNSG